jgi:two-component system sensor histidine kinase/response regulator
MSLRLLAAFFAILGFSFAARAEEKLDSLALQRIAHTALQNYLSNPDISIAQGKQVLEAGIEQRSTYFQGMACYLLAKANWAKGNLGTSAEFGFNGLRLLERSPFERLTGDVLLTLARTLTELRNFKQADKFLKQAENLATSLNSNILMGGVFRERSMLQLEQKDNQGALRTADLGLSIYEAAKDTLNSSVLYSRKARAYSALGEFDRSTTFNERALYLDSLIGNKRGLGIQYYQAAMNAYKMHHLAKSHAMLKKSFALLKEIGGLGTQIKAHYLQALIFAQQNQMDSAVAEFRLEGALRDSLYNAELNGKFQEMQSHYELRQKDDAIRSLEQSRERQTLLSLGLTIGIILLLMLTFVLWRLRLIQNRANEDLTSRNHAIEHQKEEMQVQAEKLYELNQLKSKLFSVISHDLRGPISNLHALLSLLTTKAMTADEFINISHKLKTNLNVTQRTLENLLNWSLSQMDGIKTEKKNFDVRAVIDEVCHLMLEIAERKHLTFETVDSPSALVMADLNQVQLILRNLIHNAIKFSKQNSVIRVHTTTDATHCCIRVEDNGIGMTAEETEMIQEHPHYFTKVGTHEEKGTGLGLLLCKEFVKRNGGELNIRSTPGHGTSVSFTIPLAEEELSLVVLGK